MSLRRRWKILIGIAAFALLLVGGCVVASRDEPPADDSDLVTVRSEVAMEENGVQFFLDAPEIQRVLGKNEDGDDEEYGGEPFGETWDLASAQKLLAINAGLLERFERSLSSPRWQSPQVDFIHRHRFDYLMSLRDVAKDLVVTRAAVRFETGDEVAAFEDALCVIQFGRRVQASEGITITWRVGVDIESAGILLLRRLLQKTSLSESKLAPFLAELDRWDGHDECLADAYQEEYRRNVRILTSSDVDARWQEFWELRLPQWTQNGLIGPLILKPNQTRRLLSEYFRVLLDWEAPWREPAAPLGFRQPFPEPKFVSWLPTNYVGKTLCTIALPQFPRFLHELGVLRAEIATPALLFALRRYHRDQGELPARLDDLVPKYLERVPLDPFDAKPMKYSRDLKIIYTVGPGGRNATGGDETLTWKLER